MFSIPRNAKGNYDWNAIADGRYYVEWYVGGARRREGAGVTAAQALEAQRRKRHELEGRNLGVPGFEKAGETVKKPPLHVAVANYPVCPRLILRQSRALFSFSRMRRSLITRLTPSFRRSLPETGCLSRGLPHGTRRAFPA